MRIYYAVPIYIYNFLRRFIFDFEAAEYYHANFGA